MNAKRTQQRTLPVLPLRDVVVFPYMVMPLFVGRAKSISALDEAMNEGKQLLLVSQKQADLEEPTVDDVFDVGTIANIIQLLKLPDGTVKVLVEGQQRAKINQLNDGEDHFSAEVTPIETTFGDEKELDVVKAAVLNEFESYLQLNKKIPADVLGALQRIDDADRLADTMAAHIPVTVRHKQSVLELADVQERLEYLLGMMESEADILQVEKRIRGRVKKQMEKSQRNYYLSEQIKAIRKEMDEGESEDTIDEVEQLRQKVEAAGMPADVREKVESELQKLKMMSAMSAEATVVRSYVEWMLQVPWHKRTKVKKDIAKAQQVLDADHYGLERVKERILEYLAVQARLNKIKGPILCLVGPPGVGKTSPAAFSAGCLVGALVVGLVFLGVSGAWPIALAFALITLIMPVVWINSRARKHRTELRTLWPDAIDTLVSSIRAGLSLPEALANLAEHGPVQLRGEFAAFAVDYAVSSSFENSLEAFKRRSADPVADRIAQALALAHEVGGNDLYQVLQSLSQMLRAILVCKCLDLLAP